MASPPPDTVDGKLGRVCVCGNHISERDTHHTCNECLGLRHAREALAPMGTCDHCARLPMKSLRCRLARHVSLTDDDPLLSGAPLPRDHIQVATAGASTDWGERMEQEDLRVMTESECLGGCEAQDELDSVDGSDEAILFEEDGADPFEPVEEAGLRGTLLDLHPVGARGDDSGSPTIGTSLHDVCRRAAAKLEIPWPNAPPEKTGSRYEGKRLPRVKSAERQLLPLFPECVEEATRTWSQPFSSKSPIQGGAALECVDMEEKGLFKLSLVEPLVAHHLKPEMPIYIVRTELPVEDGRFPVFYDRQSTQVCGPWCASSQCIVHVDGVSG